MEMKILEMKRIKLTILIAFVTTTIAFADEHHSSKCASKWNEVETSIHQNWSAEKVYPERTQWVKKIGMVLPKTFLGIGNGIPSLFYWDNYFSNKGLLLIDSLNVYAQAATDNLLWEVDTLGFVPNANMNWGMNRSQTPYLAMIVADVYDKYHDKKWLNSAFKTLIKEYHFWTDTSNTAIEDHTTSIKGLQRFYHHASQKELLELYAHCYERGLLDIHPDSITLKEKLLVAGNYAAEAASGMDYTPRFENRCTDFVAIDLNTNLYKYELLFHYFSKELGLKDQPNWIKRAQQRKELMNKYCWDETRGMFMDYDYKHKKFSSIASYNVILPLVMGMATALQAERTIKNLSLFEFKYGVAACENSNQRIGYQWDFPSGWAPVYQLFVDGLNTYGHKTDALRICQKYLDVVSQNYIDPFPKTYILNSKTVIRQPGFIYEKYDVVTGGINDLEYPANPFMNWTSGTYIWCMDFYRKNKD